jgi:signal transduction histidine kinase
MLLVRDSQPLRLWRIIENSPMDSEPTISLERVSAFIRQHTHDVRNGLNSLDLETSLLQELIADPEAVACVDRVRRQIRSLAEQMRSLSGLFQIPRPVAAPIAARELLMIWREKHTALAGAPAVYWVDGLGDEMVVADVEMLAWVFRELLMNAASFSEGELLTVIAAPTDDGARFELREPKSASMDPAGWEEPFSSTRRGGYGLGLWAVKRYVEANHGTITRRFLPEADCLSTQILLPKP